MNDLRARLNALRPGSHPPATPAGDAGTSGAAGVNRGACAAAAEPPLGHHVRRQPAPEWDLAPAERAATMAMLARLSRQPALASLKPEDLLFLDLETTGLSLGAGTLAFLVGLAWLESGESGLELVVEQRLMRALGQESAMLQATVGRIAARAAIATFNGKSYDLPLLQGRCVLARVEAPPARPHLDALHPARRLLAHALPDVRLTSLEAALWDLPRQDDLGGAAIPAAFFAALRGDDGLLDAILRHNADDLVTLARLPPLLARLARGGRAPTGVAACPLVLAELRLGAGERQEALEGLDAMRALPGTPRSLRQARLIKRAGGPEAAREHWLRLRGQVRAGTEPHEELAKLLEHRDRDWVGALAVVEEGLRRSLADPAGEARLRHRRARLLAKLARAGSFPGRGHSG